MARGVHLADGGPHAEAVALATAGLDAAGATAYVTTEPCCWDGRTPPCTEALLRAGVARVVVAGLDPHPQVDGKGLSALRTRGVECVILPTKQAEALNPGHAKRMVTGLPFVRVKSAVSLDGGTAMHDGESRWISCEASRRDVQRWRARSAAILSGVGTVLSDDPKLTVRDARFSGSAPARLIFDTMARTPEHAQVFQTPGRTVLVSGRRAERPTHLPPEDFWQQEGNEIDPESVLRRLASEGANEVLVEAGPTLVGSFVSHRLWDQWVVYLAPALMGKDARPVAEVQIQSMAERVRARVASVTSMGSDIRIVLEPIRA